VLRMQAECSSALLALFYSFGSIGSDLSMVKSRSWRTYPLGIVQAVWLSHLSWKVGFREKAFQQQYRNPFGSAAATLGAASWRVLVW
jgi:ABC-type sulfate transport system permease component